MRAEVARAERRRGAFGLDERRRPDPARVEDALLAFLARRMPDVWPVDLSRVAGEGRTLALFLPRGAVAVLSIESDRDRPGPAARATAARCAALRIPVATISSLDQGRAALRRFGVEPAPDRAGQGAPTLATVFGKV